MIRSSRVACLLFAIALLFAAQSASAIVTVGPSGSGCTYTKIQDAINYVLGKERNAPNDVDPYIAVAGDNVYNEALVIDSTGVTSYTNPFGRQGAFVQIYGNYDGFCDDTPNGSTATIGAGGGKSGNSVLEIRGSSSVDVVLNHLIMAEASGVARGGAINFHGNGSLNLSNVEITGNSASYGAGIFANGQNSIEIFLHSGMLIHDNNAGVAGGGIHIEGNTHLFALEDQTLIFYNTATSNDGFGGGIQVVGSGAVADIGSPGFLGFPVIYSNHARRGGGIAVQQLGTARVFSTVAGGRTRIELNTASDRGGGVYVGGKDGSGQGRFCAFGYGVNGNTAVNGAAIYGDGGDRFVVGAFLQLTASSLQPDPSTGQVCGRGPLPAAAILACTAQPCNQIDGNTATQDDGAILYAATDGVFHAEQVEFRNNDAGSVLQQLNSLNYSSFTNALIADNTLRHEVVRIGGGTDPDPPQRTFIVGSTLAGNVMNAAAAAFSVSAPADLHQLIVWQPGNRALDPSSSVETGVSVKDVITNDDLFDPAAFGEFSRVSSPDPAFVDEANGNFHLKPESPAIDYAASNGADNPNVDVDGNHRPVKLLRLTGATPYDIGAYEMQSLGDVIFLGKFEVDR